MEVLGGRYRLVELIGSGGMAVVWRAHDDVLGRPVAVKLLSPNLAKDASFRQRIQREARSAARLAHPHISVVHDYGEWTDLDGSVRPYVVMELIDGPTLADALNAGQVPWYRAAAICAQVADGLAAAHARGLVHHDIKPANIVLSTSGPKIVDFGISAIVGEEDEEGAVLGTPGYVAPERIVGCPIEPAADVYALGLTIYRCLAGKPPWDARTAEALLYAHVNTPPAPLPTHDAAGTGAPIPAELIDICTRCLAKEPGSRPTAGELAEALTGLPVPAAAGRRRAPVRAVPVDEDSALNATAFLPSSDEATTSIARTGAGAGTGTGGTGAVAGAGVAPGAAGSARRRRLVLAGAGAALAAVVAGVAVWAGGGDGRQAVAGPPTPPAPTLACTATYWVRSDNGSRFTGELMLANTGPTVIDGEWTLTFQFPATQRLERFGGERAARPAAAAHARSATTAATTTARGWGQDGQKVTAYPWRKDAKARRIDPQKQVTWTFEGAYEGSNPMPGAFAINGASCQPVLVGPVDAPPPTRFTPQENPRQSAAAPHSGAPSAAASPAGPTVAPSAADPQPTAGPPTAEPTAVEPPPVTAILDLGSILDVD